MGRQPERKKTQITSCPRPSPTQELEDPTNNTSLLDIKTLREILSNVEQSPLSDPLPNPDDEIQDITKTLKSLELSPTEPNSDTAITDNTINNDNNFSASEIADKP